MLLTANLLTLAQDAAEENANAPTATEPSAAPHSPPVQQPAQEQQQPALTEQEITALAGVINPRPSGEGAIALAMAGEGAIVKTKLFLNPGSR